MLPLLPLPGVWQSKLPLPLAKAAGAHYLIGKEFGLPGTHDALETRARTRACTMVGGGGLLLSSPTVWDRVLCPVPARLQKPSAV